jgi:predicted MFS family arabinose efflux permease
MSESECRSSRRLMLASFMTSSFATEPPGLITMLLLIEIGLTFGQHVGVSGQIRTLSSVVGVVVSLLLGALSVRFSSRSLLLTGLLLLILSAIGCSIAWDFTSMLILYSLSGMGGRMIHPMINTLIGNHFPLEERSKVLGWSAAGTSIAYLVFSPLVSFIAGFAGWRMTFLVVMLPLSLLALATTFIGVPRTVDAPESVNPQDFFAGFRSIFSNRSAIFCLLGTTLTWASFYGTLTYGISFFRESFSITVGWASLLLSAMALSKTVGHLLISPLVNRLGRKNAVVASVISMALFTTFYLVSDTLWLSLVLVCISCVLAGFMHSSVDSLNLEQVPEFRGSMMSLSTAASMIGGVIGSGLGGFTLILYGYSGIGAILGLLGIVSGIVYQIFAQDPSINNIP